MKRLICCAAALLALAALCAPVPRAGAVAYYPLVHNEPGEETIAKPGAKVFLFHSGTEEIRRALRVGDTLAVMRVQSTCEPVVVGKVRIIALVGETYFEAEVLSGAVKPNDIAHVGQASCLVLAAKPCVPR